MCLFFAASCAAGKRSQRNRGPAKVLIRSQYQNERSIVAEARSETYSGIACDTNGLITSYGIGAGVLFGWKPEEVVGKERVTIFHEPEAVQTLVPRLLKTAAETGKFEEEVTLVRKDGSKFIGLLTVRPLKRGDEITGYMGLTKPVRDI